MTENKIVQFETIPQLKLGFSAISLNEVDIINKYIDGELVEYKGNRLVVFDAYLPHQALPVSRECYQLRTCVVFKCNV